MATRVCPNCGSQYVASVRRCIDCDEILVDQAAPGGEEASASKSTPVSGGKLEYELEGWGNQLKVSLKGMLEMAGIPAVWGTTLVVPAEFEEQVDDLIETVEGAEVVEELDDEGVQIAFEIEGLSNDELDDLDARLIADHIAHAWDEEGALLVGEADEEAVAAIIDEVLAGPGEDEPDGLVTAEALSDLYVAVDKLVKEPFDQKLVRRFVTAMEAVIELPVPYGLSGDDWRALGAEAQSLADLVTVDGEDEPDDEIDETDETEPDETEPDQSDEPEADGDEVPIEPEQSEDGEAEDAADDERDDSEDAADDERDDGSEGDDDDAEDEDDSEDEDEELTPVEHARAQARALRDRLRQMV